MNPASFDNCITLTDLTVGNDSHAAIHHLSGSFASGSLTAIVGPNGSGKSTLIKTIAGMLKPMSGTCRIAPDLKLAYLPQQSELDRSFPAKVMSLVALGLWQKRGLFGRYLAEDRQAIAAALRIVGLEGFDARSIDSLSGGQLQRALFARVVVQDADLILLDEPFNAIDEKTIRDLIALIRRWHDEGRTVIVVAHDLDLMRATFPQALLLARRAVAWGPSAEVVTSENMRRARAFQEAWDENAPWCVQPSATVREVA
ncbi:zinc ABC transporter ATP-binding protein AztA [Qingshengfaniella alkalisoli]|uniref:Metal ABC transporter ATP-binding protein n=1 Tax=Qingshengfaniella alkalisoli TaxID=2599296 RepID=A0A5B8J0X0_9RHOB|nr:zinc ABC transporter ATP-binding protein AztA [Qingshengfaniella alkalisoli]QDY71413.1 metal ABC transporter ATP-binding protein [Qingshengfaniella alkalisoli]